MKLSEKKEIRIEIIQRSDLSPKETAFRMKKALEVLLNEQDLVEHFQKIKKHINGKVKKIN